MQRGLILWLAGLLLGLVAPALAAQDEPYSDWLEGYRRHLLEAELEGRPLDAVEQLHLTGRAQEVDVATWRLLIRPGAQEAGAVTFGYEDLLSMPHRSLKALLLCPGVFEDYAEWEGVALQEVLQRAGVGRDYRSILVTGLDGYETSFSRQEVEEHLMLLATGVNGRVLPPEHGYPVRIVAEYLLGGRWIKWVSEIVVQRP
jgi:sulfoxide reductase catalytic subunit YedY